MVQVALKVTCISSFPDVPHLQLSYSQQGQQVAQNLMLPIVVSKFCTPPDNPVPKEVFFSRWRAIAGLALPCNQHSWLLLMNQVLLCGIMVVVDVGISSFWCVCTACLSCIATLVGCHCTVVADTHCDVQGWSLIQQYRAGFWHCDRLYCSSAQNDSL